MQETQSPAGALHRELFIKGAGSTSKVIEAKGMLKQVDARLSELQDKGHTFVRRFKIGRNDPCPCESGKKFKRCHIDNLPGLVNALEALNARDAEKAASG